MDSFGEYLCRERELRGVTLEEISKASNISITYLKALENDDYDNLPADVFVKGFLRCYTESTGMDYTEVRLAYESFVAKKRAERKVSGQHIKTSKKSNTKIFFFLAIIAIVIVFFVLAFYYAEKTEKIKPVQSSENLTTRGIEEKKEIEKVADETIDTLLLPESTNHENLNEGEDIVKQKSEDIEVMTAEVVTTQSPEKPEKEVVDKEKLIQATEKEKTEEAIDKDFLVLTMQAEENAWISLLIDDDTEIKEALLLAGETARWKAKTKFIVTLGNVSKTSLKLNKKDVTLPATPANVLRDYVITLDSIDAQ